MSTDTTSKTLTGEQNASAHTPAPFDFEALCDNIAVAPDIYTETDAFRTLAAFAWEHLTQECRAEMLARQDIKDLIFRAARWAEQQQGNEEEDSAAEWFNTATLDERESALKSSPHFSSADLQTLEFYELNEDQAAAVIAAHAALAGATVLAIQAPE